MMRVFNATGVKDMTEPTNAAVEASEETVAGTIEATSAVLQNGGKQLSEIADAAIEKINEGAS
jgi:hypothetical protein